MTTTNPTTTEERPAYRTTAAYFSGGICGRLWMPAVKGGIPYRFDARGPWGFFQTERKDPWSFRDALLSLLANKGGDFQDARFTADSVLRVERRAARADGKGYTVHVWEREISALPDCTDLVDAETYTADICGTEDC